jgi:hypothetical protein
MMMRSEREREREETCALSLSCPHWGPMGHEGVNLTWQDGATPLLRNLILLVGGGTKGGRFCGVVAHVTVSGLPAGLTSGSPTPLVAHDDPSESPC